MIEPHSPASDERASDRFTCRVCGKAEAKEDMVPLAIVRPAVVNEIREDHADLPATGFICKEDLNRYRIRYVENLLSTEKGEISTLDRQVLESLNQHELLTSDLNQEFSSKLTLGELLADKIATFGGSWKFLITFAGVLFVWILINSIALMAKPFDPYPYILLNLVLSCLAAIQAPVIMMSQNRLESRDRLHSEHDYRINLKAELEIRHLHEKVDHLLSRQWERLAEIQQIQIELMAEVVASRQFR